MPFLSNAHTHTTFCDGVNTPEQMLDAARALGFVSLGFSEHAHQGFDEAYAMTRDKQRDYLHALRALQAAHAPGMPRVWVGVELDALADADSRAQAYAECDYVIGSAHYLCPSFEGEAVAVDGDPWRLNRYCRKVFAGDGLATARAYFDMEVDALLRDHPAVIGHFDLLRKHAARLSLFDEHSPAYRKLALDALERAFACGAVLELNTGGMARGYLRMPYPTQELLCAWRELGGRVTITSDCHDARYLAYGFDMALGMLRQAVFGSVMRLGAGDALWEEHAL